MAPLFYIPGIISDVQTLSEDESKHCVRVLRLKENDTIHLVDGAGGFYTARIIDANPKKCSVKIIEIKKEYEKRNYRLHLAVAPTKNTERFEWFVEKATEIGVDEISPLKCEHSERAFLKTERVNKVAVSAMKQSVKAYLPKVNELVSFKDFIKQNLPGQKFIAHCSDLPKKNLKEVYRVNENATILIGPEGDFSQAEIDSALEHGFQPVSLGKSRLRTETAAVVACHTINLLND
jgi:16S rRNA (uracil1498-N3)-methyltransferase